MPGFNNVATHDNYITAATIQDIVPSNGGSASIVSADVFYQIQYGPFGAGQWSPDVFAAAGAILFDPGTTGARFKSALAGTPATVSAYIAAKTEPRVQVNATAAAASVSAVTTITGRVNSSASIDGGSGFSVVHTSTGVYTVSFTTAFASPPTVTLSVVKPAAISAVTAWLGALPTTGGFVVHTWDSHNDVAADAAFTFLAEPTA